MVVVLIEQSGALQFTNIQPFSVCHKFTQGGIDQFSLGPDPAQGLRFRYQLIIQHDIGSHNTSTCVCASVYIYVYINVYSLSLCERKPHWFINSNSLGSHVVKEQGWEPELIEVEFKEAVDYYLSSP